MKNIDIEINGTDIIVAVLIIMASAFCIFGITFSYKLDIEQEKTKQIELQLQHKENNNE